MNGRRPPKRSRHLASFSAYDDEGNSIVLHVYVDVLSVGTFDDPDAEIEGLKEIRTAGGYHVNRIGQGKYEVVETGEMLTADDPAAP